MQCGVVEWTQVIFMLCGPARCFSYDNLHTECVGVAPPTSPLAAVNEDLLRPAATTWACCIIARTDLCASADALSRWSFEHKMLN